MTTKAAYMAENLPRLEQWAADYAAVGAQLEALRNVVGGVESPLSDAIWRMQDAYTAAVAVNVGDQGEWLAWYQTECRLGAQAMEARPCEGAKWRKVKTLQQLAQVIWEARE